MLRLDEDAFQPYFDNNGELSDISLVVEIGESLGEKRACRHVYGKPPFTSNCRFGSGWRLCKNTSSGFP
jgi:hypothetical protein